MIKKLLCAIMALTLSLSGAAALAEDDSIITDNTVEIKETITDNGFTHPGIGFTAESLNTMREMVLDGVSPWADYFEGMRRTRYADLDGELKKQEQIVNNGGITSFADDAQRIWVQSILYFVTGNEEYRKLPVEAIRFYSERENFFPEWFSDSHIKLGKYVRTFCEAAELMRYTEPKGESLAVTDEMIKKLDENCLKPISDKCLSTKTYFMNQHSYALQGYIAEAVLADDYERYADAVEMATVNSGNTENPPRNGAIANMIHEVSADEETGDKCEPHIQVSEMGRDQDHAKGNIDNFTLIARTADNQKTKVDPVSGAISDKDNAVTVTEFADNAIIKGADIFFAFNTGYDIPWTTIYSENNHKTDRTEKVAFYRAPAEGYHGRIMSTGTMALYYRYKGMGYDLEKDYPFVYEAAMKVKEANTDSVLTGTYIDTIHNYDFDFWTDLAPSAADSEPDKARARAALAKNIAPYEAAPENMIEMENRFIDLNVNGEYAPGAYPHNASDKPIEKLSDSDGTGYARVTLTGNDARTMVLFNADMPKNKLGVRVRTENAAALKLYNSGDYENGEMLSVNVPNTNGEWRYVIFDFSEGSVRECDRGAIWYLTARSESGEDMTIDFDKINTSEDEISPLEIKANDTAACVTGQTLEKSYAAGAGASYTADGLPDGATLDKESGTLSWTPDKAGDYAFSVTADNGAAVYTAKTKIIVRDSAEEVTNAVMRSVDKTKTYTTASRAALEKAREETDGNSFDALINAVNALEELSPELKYGGLDYSRITSCSDGAAMENLVDGSAGTNITRSEPDMNITFDFGSDFRVRADSFAIQPTDGFPARCLACNVYGSNGGEKWVKLTENAAVISDKMQTLNVIGEQKGNTYRYIRIYMPNGTNITNENAYIMGVGEFRIYGERVEEHTPDYHKAIMNGYEDNTFRPGSNISRAEAAVMLSRLYPAYMDSNMCDNAFKDVADDAWYKDDLAYMAKKKFITADENGNFRPDEPATRAEICDFIVKMKGLKGDKENVFSDAAGHAYENQIALIADAGWITGYSGGIFKPDGYITRAEFAAIVSRMEQRTDKGGSCGYTDVADDHWAVDYIAELSVAHYAE